MESKDIDILDLKPLEQDLTEQEVVSIGFILFGAERPKWLFEKLKTRRVNTNLLETYANYHDDWKSTIVEALGTIKAFECIENLGIDLTEAREFVRKSNLLNPGVKLLYQLCEACTKSITGDFINFIRENCDSVEAGLQDPLELHFLSAIIAGKIKLFPVLNGCDFSLIKKFENSKIIEKFSVKELLKKFPSTPNTLDTSATNEFREQNAGEIREQIGARNLAVTSTRNLGQTGAVNLPKTLSLAQIEPKNLQQIDRQKLQLNPLDHYKTKKMIALIINQQHFKRSTNIELLHLLPREPLAERKGTSRDMEALTSLFEKFSYQVIVKNDLTHIEILREVDKTTKQSSKYDGLIICILSHGHEGLFYGSDSIPVFVKDVKETMSSKVLLNKPKILLIQACQGDDLQPTVKKLVQLTELDGPTQSNLISGSTRADFLTFWSTIEGFASVRHVENGSWFIQELVIKINELHTTEHLMDICTSVINEVSLKRGYRDQCMLPKLESTFTKNFRFCG